MIRLGLRLTLSGGREAAIRLVVIAVAVTLGVGMLLTTLAGINAVNAQNARYSWLSTGAGPRQTHATTPAAADPAWWRLSADEFRGTQIGRIDVAATGPQSPVPPGIPALPGPGQFYASPALATLIRSTPAAELGARYPGSQIGTIGRAALPAPNSLIIVIGHTPAQLDHVAGAELVNRISTTVPSSCDGACYDIGINANGIDLVLSIVAAALIFPVLIFIGTATRLSAARREQRFAAMRLVGATPRQISIVSTVESSVAAVTGVAAGFALFFALRPVLAPIPFTGAPFYVSDLSLNTLDVLAVAIGVPVAAAIAARIALRRVTISPLGVTRRVTPKSPRAWRLLPLAVGLGELAWFVHAGRPATTPGQIQAYMTGILLTMVGLIMAGPWLTMVGARLMTRRTNRPDVLIGGRRLADNPAAGFRAVSGLVLALFVTSVAIGVITTITAHKGASRDSRADRTTIIDNLARFSGNGPQGAAPVPDSVVNAVRAIPGVTGVTVVHQLPTAGSARPSRSGPIPTTGPSGPGFGGPGLDAIASCADLATTPVLGHCPPGVQTVTLTDAAWLQENVDTRAAVFPSTMTPAQVHALPVLTITVATNGSAAVERARTALGAAYPYLYGPLTITEDHAQNVRLTAAYEQLANVVILTSLPIAGCSLAVSVVAGLNDRKRAFSLLRLAGTSLGTLRRVVSVESAVPLLALAVVSIGTGFATAAMFVHSQLKETMNPPGLSYYLTVLAGLTLSLAVIASTLPMLRRMTGPETARND